MGTKCYKILLLKLSINIKENTESYRVVAFADDWDCAGDYQRHRCLEERAGHALLRDARSYPVILEVVLVGVPGDGQRDGPDEGVEVAKKLPQLLLEHSGRPSSRQSGCRDSPGFPSCPNDWSGWACSPIFCGVALMVRRRPRILLRVVSPVDVAILALVHFHFLFH